MDKEKPLLKQLVTAFESSCHFLEASKDVVHRLSQDLDQSSLSEDDKEMLSCFTRGIEQAAEAIRNPQ